MPNNTIKYHETVVTPTHTDLTHCWYDVHRVNQRWRLVCWQHWDCWWVQSYSTYKFPLSSRTLSTTSMNTLGKFWQWLTQRLPLPRLLFLLWLDVSLPIPSHLQRSEVILLFFLFHNTVFTCSPHPHEPIYPFLCHLPSVFSVLFTLKAPFVGGNMPLTWGSNSKMSYRVVLLPGSILK